MKTINTAFEEIVASVPSHIQAEVDLSFAIANKIDNLLKLRGMTKKEFAAAIGCRPSEVTKWLSGQQNFTIRTISRISCFFGVPLITVNQLA